MRSLIATLAFGVLLAAPLVAQRSERVPPPANTQGKTLSPGISQWQSYRPSLTGQQLRTAAVVADRDLTSEKLAIIVVAAILVVVIVRAVK